MTNQRRLCMAVVLVVMGVMVDYVNTTPLEVQAEEVQAEEVLAEEVQAEEVQTEVQAEEVQAEEVQAEAVQAEEVQAEEVQAETVQAEEVQTEAVQADEVQAEAVQAEEVQAEAVQAEEVLAEEVQTEAVQAEEVQTEAVQAEVQAEEVQAEAVQAEEVECQDTQALLDQLDSLGGDNSVLRQDLLEHQGLTQRLEESVESSIQSLQNIVGVLREWRHSEDVNECASGLHNCHLFATCSDTRHGFTCTCKSGYRGNGLTCEKKCRPGAFAVGQKCFLLSDSGDVKSIDDASEACKSLGGFLAEPENPSDLFDALRIRSTLGSEPALLGWNDRESEGSWVGLSGRPFQHSLLWASDEPNNAGGEDCIEVKRSRFNDIDCSQTIRYLCEF